jgi:hypothetical protein
MTPSELKIIKDSVRKPLHDRLVSRKMKFSQSILFLFAIAGHAMSTGIDVTSEYAMLHSLCVHGGPDAVSTPLSASRGILIFILVHLSTLASNIKVAIRQYIASVNATHTHFLTATSSKWLSFANQ